MNSRYTSITRASSSLAPSQNHTEFASLPWSVALTVPRLTVQERGGTPAGCLKAGRGHSLCKGSSPVAVLPRTGTLYGSERYLGLSLSALWFCCWVVGRYAKAARIDGAMLLPMSAHH
ncbi:hypothetical protein M8818_000996 [Zalaria obscura]|uniref:Uncharacterized protein n=1 Tax=Zalaria obscura TaxID=2024903 RepID=A0ACC3SLB9_9PEZI